MHSVPITVLVPERRNVELLQRCAADPGVMLIASGETLAGAGLLGLLRVGRAMVTTPDVASRTPGCECCQVRLDLIDAVRHAVLRRRVPQRLVVVVDRPDALTADDDPACDVVTAITTLHAGSEVERLAHLGGLIVEVDARAASTRLGSSLVLWDPKIEAALAIADAVVVSGAELLTEYARGAIALSLRRLNRIGEVRFAGSATIDVERLVDVDAWNRAPTPTGSPACDRGAQPAWPTAPPQHLGTSVETVVLHRCGVLEPDATNQWLDRVVADSPSGLLRLQASLRVSTHQPRVCVAGSRSMMRSSTENDGCDPSSGNSDSVVVVIGRDLDREALAVSFESIEAAR